MKIVFYRDLNWRWGLGRGRCMGAVFFSVRNKSGRFWPCRCEHGAMPRWHSGHTAACRAALLPCKSEPWPSETSLRVSTDSRGVFVCAANGSGAHPDPCRTRRRYARSRSVSYGVAGAPGKHTTLHMLMKGNEWICSVTGRRKRAWALLFWCTPVI